MYSSMNQLLYIVWMMSQLGLDLGEVSVITGRGEPLRNLSELNWHEAVALIERLERLKQSLGFPEPQLY